MNEFVFRPTVIVRCAGTGAEVSQVSPTRYKVDFGRRGSYDFANKSEALTWFNRYKGRPAADLRIK